MIVLTMMDAASQRNLRIHRHVVLEFVAGVVDIHLDAIDQLHALLFGLDLLGRELGFGSDERNLAVIDLVLDKNPS